MSPGAQIAIDDAALLALDRDLFDVEGAPTAGNPIAEPQPSLCERLVMTDEPVSAAGVDAAWWLVLVVVLSGLLIGAAGAALVLRDRVALIVAEW